MIVVHLHCGVGTFATRTGVKTLGWLQKTSTVLFLILDQSNACCCEWGEVNCRCNIFGCNCDTDEGYCYKEMSVWHYQLHWQGCMSSKGKQFRVS